MTLSDRLNEGGDRPYPRLNIPDDYKPGVHITGNTGTVVTPATEKELKGERELLELANLDPDVWKIDTPTPEARMWQNYHEVWLHYYKFTVRKRDEALDLPALFAASRRAARTSRRATPTHLTGSTGAVVVWADPQTGKTGVRGGTAELLARVAEKQEALDAWLKRVKPDRCLFADVGDGVEGFENTPGQLATNDLSLMDQLDIESTMEFNMIETMAKHAPVDVAKTTSNHAAWRQGKGYLGRPKDDWGLYIGRQLQKQFALLPDRDVSFYSSNEWDHSMSLDFMGTIIGLHHGHMVNRPEAIPLWWAKQTHGAGAVADADVLITGHFHHFRALSTGRNRITGKVKWWLQAPTLDNGSDWFRNLQGEDSDPGLMVFLVDENGFNLRSLDVL